MFKALLAKLHIGKKKEVPVQQESPTTPRFIEPVQPKHKKEIRTPRKDADIFSQVIIHSSGKKCGGFKQENRPRRYIPESGDVFN